MALSDEVQARVSAQLLRELTNHGDATQTTINTARLGAACTDASAEFLRLTGLKFDTADPVHVVAGVKGAIYFLHSYTGLGGAATDWWKTVFTEACSQIAVSTGTRRRLMPRSSSVLSPSERRTSSRPYFDHGRWDDYVLQPPLGTDDDFVDREA